MGKNDHFHLQIKITVHFSEPTSIYSPCLLAQVHFFSAQDFSPKVFCFRAQDHQHNYTQPKSMKHQGKSQVEIGAWIEQKILAEKMMLFPSFVSPPSCIPASAVPAF